MLPRWEAATSATPDIGADPSVFGSSWKLEDDEHQPDVPHPPVHPWEMTVAEVYMTRAVVHQHFNLVKDALNIQKSAEEKFHDRVCRWKPAVTFHFLPDDASQDNNDVGVTSFFVLFGS